MRLLSFDLVIFLAGYLIQPIRFMKKPSDYFAFFTVALVSFACAFSYYQTSDGKEAGDFLFAFVALSGVYLAIWLYKKISPKVTGTMLLIVVVLFLYQYFDGLLDPNSYDAVEIFGEMLFIPSLIALVLLLYPKNLHRVFEFLLYLLFVAINTVLILSQIIFALGILEGGTNLPSFVSKGYLFIIGMLVFYLVIYALMLARTFIFPPSKKFEKALIDLYEDKKLPFGSTLALFAVLAGILGTNLILKIVPSGILIGLILVIVSTPLSFGKPVGN